MENMTFKQLLNDYKIEIPIIQRDYAQGRKSPKIDRIRTEFLEDIKRVSTDDKPLHLDFIYGFTKGGKFIPLDGQQRLTTLFLLHWYFRLKNDKDVPQDEKVNLSNFGYKTHDRPERFIKFLIGKEDSALLTGDTLSKMIGESNGFRIEWKQEPTITGMLVMLDAIHETFKDIGNDIESKDFLDKITFSFFDMGENKLTDDLYIKMNSRGKPLTDFDTFKAKFERILGDNKEFEHKVDGEWVDLFWQYRDKKQFTIDQPFLRMFWVLTEILYFKFIGTSDDSNIFVNKWKDNNPILDYKLIEQVYKTQEHAQDAIKLLFSWLDLCKELGEGEIKNEFSRLFCEEKQAEKYSTHLSIYGKQVDLFSRSTKGRVIQPDLLLFYSVLQSKFKSDRDRIRIIRNLALADIMRPRDFKNQLAFIDYVLSHNTIPQASGSGFNSDLIKEEQFKQEILQKHPQLKEILWKLENNKYLKGTIHLFNPCLEGGNLKKALQFEQAFSLYFNDNDGIGDLFRRALLTKGDYSLYDRGGSGYMGIWEERYHLCSSHAEWHTFFSSFDEDTRKKHQLVRDLFEDIYRLSNKENADKKLEELIDKIDDKDSYLYKLIKKPEILKYSEYKRFMWNDKEQISNILKYSSYRHENYKAYDKF